MALSNAEAILMGFCVASSPQDCGVVKILWGEIIIEDDILNCKEQLIEYCNDDSVHSLLLLTFPEVLWYVLMTITKDFNIDTQREIKSILNDEMKETKFNAKDLDINHKMRAVPLPELEKVEEIKLDEISSDINVEDFSQKAAEIGLLALDGKDGPAKDTLIFTASIALSIIKKIQFTDAADQIKKAINSGKAKEFFYNAR